MHEYYTFSCATESDSVDCLPCPPFLGTHDLDTITGPFIYDAQPPKDISFVPLNQTEVFRSDVLLEKYSHDLHLREFVPIIKVCHPEG